MQSTYWSEKLNKCKCKVLTGQRRCWKWSPCTSMHFCERCSMLSYTRCNSAVSIHRIELTPRCNSAASILRIDSAELHRVYDNMLQRAQKCIDVQGDHFQHLLWPVSTSHLHLFNFLYRVRDLRLHWSTRRRAGFSCATLYYNLQNRHLNETSTFWRVKVYYKYSPLVAHPHLKNARPSPCYFWRW